MGQQQQRRGGGQAPRQMQRQQQPRINYEQAAADVISGLEVHRPQLEPLLPAGTKWSRFHAEISTLLMQNPGILKCTTASIIRGVMKAVYDGLHLDGREAALVPSENTYGKGDRAVTKIEARYNPMVAGLRKQIIQGGLVDDVVTTVVYEGEPYRVIRGSEPRLEHEEIPSKRGPGKKIVAVYSMAWLKNGRVTFETMTASQVEAVRDMAATDKVWDKNDHEMYRKTVLRRHRKSLPGGNEIRDAEMEVLFPHMSTAAAHAALPAPPKPERRDYQPALEDRSNDNLFTNFDRAADEAFAEEPAGEEQGGDRQEPRKKAAKTPGPAEGESESRNATDQTTDDNGRDDEVAKPAFPVPDPAPADEAGWRAYADGLKAAIPELPDVDALNLERRSHQPLLDRAPAAIAEELAAAFADALTDLVAGGGQ